MRHDCQLVHACRKKTFSLLGGFSLAGFFLLTAVGSATAKPDLKSLTTRAITISASPVANFSNSDDRRRFGRLIFRGGLILRSSSSYFGGFSGLRVDDKGENFIAVSDAGFWLRGKLTRRGRAPSGITNAQVGPLRALSGRVLTGVPETDAEAIELMSGTPKDGRALIGFERIHRIGRFSLSKEGVSKPSRYLKLPNYIKGLKSNRGLESVALLKGGPRDGTLVYFAEGRFDSRGHMRGWMRRKNGRTSEIFVEPISGFDMTDATSTPDGDLIILERRFRFSEGVKMRLRLISAKDIRPGAVLKGETLFEADQKYFIDNMEGVTTHRSRLGRTVITLISDDNFSFLQRTILLQFVLSEDKRS